MPTRLVFFMLVALATAAEAQTPPELPKNDATASIGWFGGQYPGLQPYNRWHQSLFSGAAIGHYWTDHLKSEVEAAWLSRVSFESSEIEDLAGGAAFVRSTYKFDTLKFSFSQLYQFGENAWVHPYAGIGADVDSVRSLEARPAQFITFLASGRPTTTPVSVPALVERDTTVRAHPFVRAGLKAYSSDRVFFTTELKLAFVDGLQHALWKTGVGFDF